MAITHYYKYYNDDLEDLIKRIKPEYLSSDLYKNIDVENDIFLIHCIYEVIISTQLYRKKEIQNYIWDKIKPNIVISKCSFYDIENFKFGYNLLFNYCWSHKFYANYYENEHKAKRISMIAYNNRPLYMKLYDSNFALVFFLLLTIISQVMIHNSFDFLQYTDETPMGLLGMNALFWFWSFMLGNGIKKNWTIPLFAFAFIICNSYYYILDPYAINIQYEMCEFRSDIVIDLAKRNFIIGLIFLLWIPILDANMKRLDEIYSKQ